jgi:hypothetical protein
LDTFSHLGIFSGVPNNYTDLLKGVLETGTCIHQKAKLWFGAGTEEASSTTVRKKSRTYW